MLLCAVTLSSACFTSSCSGTGRNVAERDEIWNDISIEETVSTSFHSFRDNTFTGIDSNGNIVMTGIVQKTAMVLDADDGSAKGSITVSSTYPENLPETDGWLDSFAYVINGTSYLEINRVPEGYYDGSQDISTSYYALDTDGMYVVGRRMLFDSTNLVTVGCWTTSLGTCLAESSDPWMSFDDEEHEGLTLYCFRDIDDPDRIPLEDTLGDYIANVRFVVSLDSDTLIISCMMFDGSIKSLRADLSRDEIEVTEDGVPEYLTGKVMVSEAPDDGFYVTDAAGAYKVPASDTALDKPSYEKLADWSRCTEDMVLMSEMTPYGCDEDGNLMLLGFSSRVEIDQSCKAMVARAERCNFPYGERQEITVGCIDVVPEVIGQNIISFNRTSEDKYLRIVLISCDGMEPSVDFGKNGDVFDLTDEQIESLRIHAYRDYLTGDDVPDIVLTDGMQAQFQSPGIFTDLKSYMDRGAGGFNRDDYMGNVFEHAQIGSSLYTLPLYYYVYGLVEVSSAATIYGSAKVSEITSISFDEYEDMVQNKWEGEDPLADIMDRDMCFGEMLSTQYADFVDLETGTYDFSGDGFIKILDYVSTLEYSDDYIIYYTYDPEKAYFVEYASLCYSTDISSFSYYLSGCTWMGIPTEDGNTPSLGAAIAGGITTGCEDKDAAWEIIMYLLSEEAQTEGNGYFGLPVNKSVSQSDFEIPNHAYSFVEELTESATRMYFYDCDLNAISSEAIEDYVSGDATADETGEFLGAHIMTS